MADDQFERTLQVELAALLEGAAPPHPRWADAPAARRVARQRRRWPFIRLSLAAAAAVAIVTVGVYVAGTATPAPVGSPSASSIPATLPGGCADTWVRAGPGPDAAAIRGIEDLPWAAASPASTAIRAYFWNTPILRADSGGNKVLLVIPDAHGESATIKGSPADRPGELIDLTVRPVLSPPGNYVASLDLGIAGCWDLRVSAGAVQAVFHLVVAPAPTGSVATKAPEILRYTTAIGWLDGRLLVSDSPSPDGEGTRVWLLDPTAVGTWTERPALAPPSSTELATDGRTVAYVQGTSDGHARTIELRDAAGRRRAVELPGDVGNDRVWGNDGSVVPQSGGGFVLTWASILAIVADDGSVATHSIPSGFLVMRPTSDRDRYLLVRADDVNVPYGFSNRAPASLWLWDRTSGTNQLVVADASEATPSASGLALVRRGDGSWWRILADGTLQTVLPPGRQALTVSPGGEWYVGRSACAADTLPERCVQPFGRLDASSTMTVNGVIWSHAWHDEVLGAVVDLPFPWQPSGIVVVDGTTARMFALP